jgi:hypothetical protein
MSELVAELSRQIAEAVRAIPREETAEGEAAEP